MRAIRVWALVAACVTAAACSSSASNSDGGQGGAGSGGNTGAGGVTSSGGHTGAGGIAVDGGPDGMMASSSCNPACGGGSVCVGSGTQGGAVFFPDGGVCSPGRHVSNGFCVQDLSFACKPIPNGCNGTATCACASSLCTAGSCSAPSAGELDCILAVP